MPEEITLDELIRRLERLRHLDPIVEVGGCGACVEHTDSFFQTYEICIRAD